jgi:hypothetical protein
MLETEKQIEIGKLVFKAFSEKDKANVLEDQAIACMEAIISPDEVCSRS